MTSDENGPKQGRGGIPFQNVHAQDHDDANGPNNKRVVKEVKTKPLHKGNFQDRKRSEVVLFQAAAKLGNLVLRAIF